MRTLNETEQIIVEKIKEVGGYKNFLEVIFPKYPRYKCHTCKAIIFENPCPICGTDAGLLPMCPLDHCHCSHQITSGVSYCPVCGEAECPDCGSHDVVQISRVTGYLQEVSGWNIGKQQELKDRTRYNL